MSWRPHGRATVNPSAPSAFGVCDRCAFLYNLSDLSWQWDWRGPRLANLRILVCTPCYDRAQEQLRPVILPPDPVSRANPRPEPFAQDNQGISAVQASKPPNLR